MTVYRTGSTVPFGPEALRELSQKQFVGNESDSDEYRETQPGKGLYHLCVACHVAKSDDPRYSDMMRLAEVWIIAREEECPTSAYAGSEELATLLAVAHDVWWDSGFHPYYDEVDELSESLAD